MAKYTAQAPTWFTPGPHPSFLTRMEARGITSIDVDKELKLVKRRLAKKIAPTIPRSIASGTITYMSEYCKLNHLLYVDPVFCRPIDLGDDEPDAPNEPDGTIVHRVAQGEPDDRMEAQVVLTSCNWSNLMTEATRTTTPTNATLAGIMGRLGIDARQCADYLGVPITTLRNWLTTERIPNASALRLIEVLAVIETLAPAIHAHLIPEPVPLKRPGRRPKAG